MKIVIPGGTGQIGAVLRRWFTNRGDDVVVLSRSPDRHRDSLEQTGDPGGECRLAKWDGKSRGDWCSEIDGADVVINLAGRSVNCRYTDENLRQMMDSRVDSTWAVGEAIAESDDPPPVWLQMSTATIYAHRFDAPNDEETGIIGGDEPDVPDYWAYSVEIAKNWEKTLREADTPQTRKVAMRAAMVMNRDADGIFDTLSRLVRFRLGGAVGGGDQYVSWIHERDYARAIQWLIEHDEIDGPVNLAAPDPLPQREFMAELRSAWGVNIGLPATAWMAEIGAFFMRTDTELILKSRRVVPGRLQEAGFTFEYPDWPDAAEDLVQRWRDHRS